MSEVIKRPKSDKNKVILEAKPNIYSPQQINKAKKRHPDSLNFSKIISGEIEIVMDSFTNHFDRQEKKHKKELKEMERKAREKGYQEGYDAAIDKERSEQINAIDSLLKEAKKKSEQTIRGIELKVIDLAVHLAEQITRKTIREYPEIVEKIVQDAMSYLIGSETVILKVSEDDFEAINSRYDKWLQLSGSSKEFRIEVDRRLKSGDCLVETEGGIIDASVTDRLETIAEEIVKATK